MLTYFGFFIAKFSSVTRSSSSLPENEVVKWLLWVFWLYLYYIKTETERFSYSVDLLSAAGDDWLVQNLLSCGPLCRILRHKRMTRTLMWYPWQRQAEWFQTSNHLFHNNLKQDYCRIMLLTHLIKALIHQLDQCRWINIRVHLHSPVALNYFHTEVQRVLYGYKQQKQFILGIWLRQIIKIIFSKLTNLPLHQMFL